MKLNVRLNRVIIRLSVMGIRLEVIITEVDVASRPTDGIDSRGFHLVKRGFPRSRR